MAGAKLEDGDYLDFVEVDPSGRYGRYNEVLGKGASKTVYRAFDEYEGIEVAWNQVRLRDFLQSPQDLERLYCEIHLLKSLKHKNIMKFYTSWYDTSKRNLNFITEMFTSGTLRQYRQRYRRVNIRAVKHWCRQILMGLIYLHSQEPPVIHRDLKCDNIFINGNQGEVKIGDLGLAAILLKSKTVHCVGTPEFMAPEVYEEEYDELVDIYSFGMCVLEMVTFEYPYSECTHPAQIYKKVISGTKPEALYKVKDQGIRQFIEKCLVTASQRLSARELMKDPFLHDDEHGSIISNGDAIGMGQCIPHQHSNGALELECSDDELEIHGMELLNNQEENFTNMDITIKGRLKEDGGVFVRLRIRDKDGRVRNIYFPFDLEADTALSVATEMVGELDITDYEVTRIAEMIDGELSSLVPGWKVVPDVDDSRRLSTKNLCEKCASNVSSCSSLLEYMMYRSPGCEDLQSFYCSNLECAAMHGRFEEITYQMEGSHGEDDHLYRSFSMNVQTISRTKMANESRDLHMNSETQLHEDGSNFALGDENESLFYPSSSQTNLDEKIEDSRRERSSSWRSLDISNDGKMKSFHQANNCTFRIPRDNDEQVSDFRSLSSPILRTKSLPVESSVV